MKIRLQIRGPFGICGYSAETSLASCDEDLRKLWDEFEAKKDILYAFSNNDIGFYGLMWLTEGNRYRYLIGVETDSPEIHPEGTVIMQVTSAEYAVVSVPASQSAMDAWTEFYEKALPDAGLQPAPGHVFDFEYYPQGGGADYELWTPVVRK